MTDAPLDFPRTPRLLLRAACPDDLDPLHRIFSSSEAMRYWDRPAYTDIADTQRFLDHFINADWDNREEYILEYQGTCIGKAGMWKRAEIGYILHPDYWGQGLITEALTAILPRIFQRFGGVHSLTAEIDPRNLGSERVLRKQGFEKTGFAEKNFRYGDTEWCDTAYYELTRAAWDQHRRAD